MFIPTSPDDEVVGRYGALEVVATTLLFPDLGRRDKSLGLPGSSRPRAKRSTLQYSKPYLPKGDIMGKLEGKVAVITGGSSGLALASARLFVEEGAYVFITGRRQEALDEAVKLIGRNVTGVRGDAANLDDPDRLFDTVKREKSKIEVLFASAGKGEPAILGEITEQHFDSAFNLIARGTLFTVQKALPLFNDGASTLMTGSVASVKGFPGFGVYAASKAALRSFARTWLNELKGRKIRVNVLSPGPIDTPDSQGFDEETKRMFASLIPRGTMGRPEEVAASALFLASDDSSFVNGVELSVDGGFSAILIGSLSQCTAPMRSLRPTTSGLASMTTPVNASESSRTMSGLALQFY